MPAGSHVGWGLVLSLLLHATGIAVLSLALPRLSVSPEVVRQVDFSVLSASLEEAPAPAADPAPAAAAAPPARPDEPELAAAVVEVVQNPRAEVEVSPALDPKPSPVAAPKPARKAPARPLTAAAPTPQPSAAQPTAATPNDLPARSDADPRSDGSALERVLRKIASTTQLTQDERRRAMLMVLRTWEDPSRRKSAEELVDALLKNVRSPSSPSPSPSPSPAH
jgi:hypothetical protein